MLSISTLSSGSKGNCYRVDNGSSPILLECGVRFKEIQKWLNFRVNDIAACWISHEHKDHSKAALDLMESGVDCYMSEGTAKELKLPEYHNRLHIVRAGEVVQAEDWTVLPFEAKHDAKEPLGFLMQSGADKLLYLTDSFYCKYKFVGLTHIMVECNYCKDILEANCDSGLMHPKLRNRIMRSHFSLEHVKEFLSAIDLHLVREIHLIHLSEDNADPQRCRDEVEALTGIPTYIA